MRWGTWLLAGLLAAVWGDLLFGKGSLGDVRALQAKLDRQIAANDSARERNARTLSELNDLREGLEMVEERARGELGMLRPDEILVQYTQRK